MKKILFALVCGSFATATIVSCGGGASTENTAKAQMAIDSTVNAKLGTMKAELDAKCQARVDSAATILADSLTKAGVKAPVVAAPAPARAQAAPAKPAAAPAKPAAAPAKPATVGNGKPSMNGAATGTVGNGKPSMDGTPKAGEAKTVGNGKPKM